MRGGFFDYLSFKLENENPFKCIRYLKVMEDWLREKEKHDAADEFLRYRMQLEKWLFISKVMTERLINVIHDAEWWASGYCGEDTFDKAWEEFLGGSEKRKGENKNGQDRN